MKALFSVMLTGLLAVAPALAQSGPEVRPIQDAPQAQTAQSAPRASQDRVGQDRVGQNAGADRLAPSRTPDTRSDSWSVVQVQSALRQRGYEIGAADGILGPQTRDALRKFQEENQLQVSGEVDLQTLAALDIPIERQIPTSRYGAAPSGWVTGPGAGPRSGGDSGSGRGPSAYDGAPRFVPGTPAPTR